MEENSSVKIYSTPSCSFCRKIRSYLEENGIRFEEFNVQEDRDAWNEMVKLSRQMGVPVIVIDGEVIIGFNEVALKEKLGI